jgi:hypothetical protein
MSSAADDVPMLSDGCIGANSDAGAYSLGLIKPRTFASSALIYAVPQVGDHWILRRFSICYTASVV